MRWDCNEDGDSAGERHSQRRAARIILATVPSLMLAACAPATSTSSSRTYPTGPQIAYVVNGAGWVPFNLLRHSTSRAMTAPKVEAVTVAPGARTAYGIGHDGIVPIDLQTGAIGKPIAAMSDCQSIATGGSGQTIYVAGCGTNGADFTTITPVDVKTGVASTPIAVPGGPEAVYVAPDGRTAYVGTNGAATLSLVDLATGALGKVISVPDGVGELAFSDDGTMAYATGNTDKGIGGGKQVSFVTPIDLRTGIAGTPIALMHDPYGIVVSPDGRTAYVTGGNVPVGIVGPPTPPDVTAINLVAGRVEATFSIPGGAGSIFNSTSG